MAEAELERRLEVVRRQGGWDPKLMRMVATALQEATAPRDLVRLSSLLEEVGGTADVKACLRPGLLQIVVDAWLAATRRRWEDDACRSPTQVHAVYRNASDVIGRVLLRGTFHSEDHPKRLVDVYRAVAPVVCTLLDQPRDVVDQRLGFICLLYASKTAADTEAACLWAKRRLRWVISGCGSEDAVVREAAVQCVPFFPESLAASVVTEIDWPSFFRQPYTGTEQDAQPGLACLRASMMSLRKRPDTAVHAPWAASALPMAHCLWNNANSAAGRVGVLQILSCLDLPPLRCVSEAALAEFTVRNCFEGTDSTHVAAKMVADRLKDVPADVAELAMEWYVHQLDATTRTSPIEVALDSWKRLAGVTPALVKPYARRVLCFIQDVASSNPASVPTDSWRILQHLVETPLLRNAVFESDVDRQLCITLIDIASQQAVGPVYLSFALMQWLRHTSPLECAEALHKYYTSAAQWKHVQEVGGTAELLQMWAMLVGCQDRIALITPYLGPIAEVAVAFATSGSILPVEHGFRHDPVRVALRLLGIVAERIGPLEDDEPASVRAFATSAVAAIQPWLCEAPCPTITAEAKRAARRLRRSLPAAWLEALTGDAPNPDESEAAEEEKDDEMNRAVWAKLIQ